MKRLFASTICLLIGIVSVSLSAQTSNKKGVSVSEITNGTFYPKSAGKNFRSMPDGQFFTQISSDRKSILKCSFATGQVIETLFSLDNVEGGRGIKAIEQYSIAPSGHHILIYTEVQSIYRRSYNAVVYHYDVRRNKLEPLSREGGRIAIPTFSPDGRMVAFVRDNNIFVRKFDFDSEIQITNDGKYNHIINGTTDWVYEEELTTTQLMTWSKDNRFLAYVRSDESKVPAYDMPIYNSGAFYPTNYSYKYPKAGEQNSVVTLFVHDLSLKQSKQVALPLDKDGYIPRIEFTSFANGLAVATLNRRQDLFRLYMVNPQSLVPKLTIETKDQRYVNSDFIQSMQITENGFIMLNEEDGYTHIYSYGPGGQDKKKVVGGKYDVLALYGQDKSGNIYYQAADETPIRRRVLKVDKRGRITPLAAQKGINSAVFCSDFSYFINDYSADNTPPLITIRSGKDGRELRTLEDNAELKARLSNYNIASKEFISLPIQGGIELNGWLLKPDHFDANRQYPVVMVQYSGPDSQEVLDEYNVDWVQALVQEGYIVACFDGRGTGSRGTEWRKCTYLNLGKYESDDQIAAAQALSKLSYVDGKRIAIWGWSFGGYNVLRCLCRGNGVFAAGVAIAPVTDWRFYDTIYTERFMRTPQENPSGYSTSSCLTIAKDLKGKLLLISGSADDNVHLQNTMLMSEALVYNNIPFEMAVYNDRNHGIYGGNARPHLYNKVIEFLNRSLK